MFFGWMWLPNVVLVLKTRMEMYVAQEVSVAPKVLWGARSRGGTGQEKQVRCVSHGSDCLECQGVSIQSKLYLQFWSFKKWTEIRLYCNTKWQFSIYWAWSTLKDGHKPSDLLSGVLWQRDVERTRPSWGNNKELSSTQARNLDKGLGT